MSALTPDQIAQKWATNAAAATTSMQAGVQAVRQAPGQLAAAQQAAYLANVQASANKWAANVSKVSLTDWQTAMIQKGIPRVATGVQAAQPAFSQFMTKLVPYINSGLGALPARGTIDQNINRAVAWMRYMSQFSA